jgi:hypothetical protein
MAEPLHPAFTGHLPSFFTARGETDVLMIILPVILVIFLQVIGTLYFWLLHLPARYASTKIQYELVCALAVISLFSRMHIFWVAALILALIELPDFSGLFQRIAGATEKIVRNSEQKRSHAKKVDR